MKKLMVLVVALSFLLGVCAVAQDTMQAPAEKWPPPHP